ncbi:MAG: hypothetical protein AAGF71_00650 [Pseudomonadota bacterium]
MLLVFGLVIGLAWPALAEALASHVPELIGLLLVISAFGIGAKAAVASLLELRWSLPAVLVLQIALPLLMASALWLGDAIQTPLGLALILATASPALTGSMTLASILGQDTVRTMQVMVLGVALFPVTTLVVLSLVPIAGDDVRLVEVGLRALATICVTVAAGFALRAWLLPNPTPAARHATNGAAALCSTLIVIGLVAALAPVLRNDPMAAVLWIVFAFVLCFGLQLATLVSLTRGPLAHAAGPLALAAGNRNIVLFLVALPPDVMAPVQVFIACWQLPMYLTPILLAPLYARLSPGE